MALDKSKKEVLIKEKGEKKSRNEIQWDARVKEWISWTDIQESCSSAVVISYVLRSVVTQITCSCVCGVGYVRETCRTVYENE